MRAYIRHPVDVPIELLPVENVGNKNNRIQDVSVGGLSFSSRECLPVGATVKIQISFVDPPFEAEAKVIWCLSRSGCYETGIEFTTEQDAYTARMVEQVCHIEHYRLWVQEVEGRNIDGEHAAQEWISKFAKDFPKITD